MKQGILGLAGMVCLLCAWQAHATIYDLNAQWSDASNPNGVWAYREGPNALPHVTSWQSTLGGWSSAQPGWARSENGTNRIPFFFKSNGSETFAHDFQAGDVLIHTADGTNGIGNSAGDFLWTSPDTGAANITGGVWMGRDIGRSNHWALAKNGTLLTEGDIASGDPYSRATPFNLATGSGGAAAVTNIPIIVGDQFTLTLTQTGAAGDFVGTNLTITTTVPEPATVALFVAVPTFLFARRRRA